MDMSGHYSRLLRLPREIRDHIYDYVLVYDKISLEAGVTKAPRSRIAVGGEIGFSDKLYQIHKLRYPLCDRSTWEIPLSDLDIPEPEFQLDSNKVCMTYQLAYSKGRDSPSRVDLSLFLTCKQVYAEASQTFYGRNKFSFTLTYCIPTAATFLRDRPAAALQHIRYLELRLTEVEERPPEREAGHMGLHVLQYDYGFFSQLCSLVASPKMNLAHLHLSCETLWANDLHGVESMSDIFEYNRTQTSTAEDCIAAAPWISSLLNIKTLDHLSVHWFDGRNIRMVGKIADMMGRHMFEARQSPITKNGANSEERCVEILHQLDWNDCDPPYGAVVLYNPIDHTIKHWACGIYNMGQRLRRADPEIVDNLCLEFSHPTLVEHSERHSYYLLSSYFEWPQKR